MKKQVKEDYSYRYNGFGKTYKCGDCGKLKQLWDEYRCHKCWYKETWLKNR